MGNERWPSEETPLCVDCLDPVDPLETVCPNCGRAVGQLTPYLPFESIRWEAQGWGRIWDDMWRPGASIMGRLFRLLMIVICVPVVLLAMVPYLWRALREA